MVRRILFAAIWGGIALVSLSGGMKNFAENVVTSDSSDTESVFLGATKEREKWNLPNLPNLPLPRLPSLPGHEPPPSPVATIQLPGIRTDSTPANSETLTWDAIRLSATQSSPLVIQPGSTAAGRNGNGNTINSANGGSAWNRTGKIGTATMEVQIPLRNVAEPIVVSAKKGWSQRINNTEVFLLEGNCQIQQGHGTVSAPRAAVWVPIQETIPFVNMDTLPPPPKRNDGTDTNSYTNPYTNTEIPTKTITVFLDSEDDKHPLLVQMDPQKPHTTQKKRAWLGQFTTTAGVSILMDSPQTDMETRPDFSEMTAAENSFAASETEMIQFFARADSLRRGEETGIEQVQFIAPGSSGNMFQFANSDVPLRSVQFYSRNDTSMDIRYMTDPLTNRGMTLVSNGFTLIIEGLQTDSAGNIMGTSGITSSDILDLSADRGLIWSESLQNLRDRDSKVMAKELDFEVYLEGNIIFRQGDTVIYADRMYYDAKNKVGYILKSEMLTPIIAGDGDVGMIRLKSDVLQQLGQGMFVGHHSYVTTSRLGQPVYRLQSDVMTVKERETMQTDPFTGLPIRDRVTGEILTDKKYNLVAENNLVYYRSVPFLYWPWMATDLTDRTFYLRSAKYANDGTNGHQFLTTWNPWQVFNIKNRPDGVDWDLTFDYLSKRGFGHGTNITYARNSFFGCETPTAGIFDYYGISDRGRDNLGLERHDVTFPQSYRYRLLWNHRQYLGNDWTLSAEVGKASDRNYLYQYFPNEWNNQKNQTTDIDLRRTRGNTSLSLFGSVRTNDFQTQSSWLPNLSYTRIGDSFLEDLFTYHSRSQIGFAKFQTTTRPEDPTDAAMFEYLPWEVNQYGNPLDISTEMLSSRHEVNLPFNVGAVRVVPFILGGLAHWGKDQDSNSVDRIYGQAGVRANLPMWKLMPSYKNRMFYANGLAHKVDFDAVFAHTKSSTRWDNLLLLDPLDDFSTEDFRRRFTVTTFGGAVPVQYDERYYAIRNGIAGSVTTPNTELVSDMTTLRLGMTNRWQTKRGAVGREHIIDWITLETNVTVFPDANQNFGSNVGLMDFDFRWHVGDRFSVLSSGVYDVFTDGQKITRIGVQSVRPQRGKMYLGIDRLEGPFRSTYLNLNMDYEMNEKYSLIYGTSFDLDAGRNLGQSLRIFRTGESFRVGVSLTYDWTRNNAGIGFDIIPTTLYALNRRNSRDDYPGIIPK